jgi:hypothetical protein
VRGEVFTPTSLALSEADGGSEDHRASQEEVLGRTPSYPDFSTGRYWERPGQELQAMTPYR